MKRTVLGLLAFFTLFPFTWMALTALSPEADIFSRSAHVVPSHLVWSNLVRVWYSFPYGRWLSNSTVVSFVGATLSTLLSVTAGYAFAKFQFRAKPLLFAGLLATMMIPQQVLIAPQFLLMAKAHGLNTYWAVILPGAAHAFGVYLSRQFLSGIPNELLEAARLDGASEWTIFWRIVIPLSKPLLAVLFLFTVLDRWNEFAWPLVVLQDRQAMTLPVGLSLLFGEHSTDWVAIMTVALCTAIPMLAIFALFQRFLVGGIAREGIK